MKPPHKHTHMSSDHCSLVANGKSVENLFPLITKSMSRTVIALGYMLIYAGGIFNRIFSSWAVEFRFYYL